MVLGTILVLGMEQREERRKIMTKHDDIIARLRNAWVRSGSMNCLTRDENDLLIWEAKNSLEAKESEIERLDKPYILAVNGRRAFRKMWRDERTNTEEAEHARAESAEALLIQSGVVDELNDRIVAAEIFINEVRKYANLCYPGSAKMNAALTAYDKTMATCKG